MNKRNMQAASNLQKSISYIGVDTDDSRLEKDILRDIYTKAGATTEDYPQGVYIYYRDGFYIAVNYSSETVR